MFKDILTIISCFIGTAIILECCFGLIRYLKEKKYEKEQCERLRNRYHN